jgi:molecular chaperone DnaK
MMKDAEAHAEEYRQRKDEAEARNQGDTLVYQTDKLLREQGEKLDADERSAVESKLGDLREALGGDDLEAIKTATEMLMMASQEFTQKLYESAAQAEGGGDAAGSTTPPPDDDEVVDAEIVDDESETS